MSASIACFGLLVADCVTATVDRLPARGTLEIVDRVELHVGGCAANTAISLAKLGVGVAILGGVGTDGLGDFVLNAVRAAGVDTIGVKQFDSAPTAATTVCVHSDAERSFLHVPGANAVFLSGDTHWDATQDVVIFHIAGPQLMGALEAENGIVAVAREARQRGMTVTLDTVMNPRSLGWNALKDALPFVGWFLPSHAEAHALSGESDPIRQVQFFRASGATNVAVKLGDAGCFVAPDGEEPFTMPGYTVTAVDSLGAGDAWVAGFLLGILRGWDAQTTARFANAVGASAVQAYGATTGIRKETEILTFIHEQKQNKVI
ncbi:MAG: carbohydrate kinase family protein [Fibrella sp.]|nr:carbohydrate kinase family protein [Armatimonadota bacterium]